MFSDTNSTCKICNKRFNDSLKQYIMLNCGHLVHYECLCKNNNLCENNNLCNGICDICSIPITDIFNEFQVSEQKKIDILSLRKTSWKPMPYNYLNLIYRVPCFLYILFRLNIRYYYLTMIKNISHNVKNKDDKDDNKYYDKLYEDTFFDFFNSVKKTFNIKINYYGLNNLVNNPGKKIYISNHVSNYDLFVVGSVIKSGGVISKTVNNFIVRSLTNICPSLIISRGEKNNTVKLIEDFIDKYNHIFVCPQGIFSHHTTISKFRTGAFATKYNVQPCILRYKDNVSSLSIFDMFLIDSVEVDFIIMDIVDRQDLSARKYADYVLDLMIDKSHMKKSNVISYDVNDKNK